MTPSTIIIKNPLSSTVVMTRQPNSMTCQKCNYAQKIPYTSVVVDKILTLRCTNANNSSFKVNNNNVEF